MTKPATVVALFAALAASVVGQQRPDVDPGVSRLALYRPVLPDARVVVLRSDADAERLAQAAWGRDEPQLHVDFEQSQVVVVCFGPKLRSPAGGPLDLQLESARIEDGVLRLVVRSALPFGPDRDTPEADEPVLYPSVFVRAPQTGRVEVDVVGARCSDPARDFRPITGADLAVRVAPDAMPLRARMREVPVDPRHRDRRKTASVRLETGEDRQVLVIHWGRLGPALYTLETTHASLVDDVTRVTVRADVTYPAFYSGPPEWYPELRIEMPAAQKVLLEVVRTGAPLEEGEAADLAPQDGASLEVRVDRSRVRG